MKHDSNVAFRFGAVRRMAGVAVMATGLTSAGACLPAGSAGNVGSPPSTVLVASSRVGSDSADSDRLSVGASMYCRSVAGHSTAIPTGGDAEAFRSYWDGRRTAEFGAVITAGGSAAHAWRRVARFTRDEATPVLAAHGYDPASVPVEPADVVDAREAIARYDVEVCGVPESRVTVAS